MKTAPATSREGTAASSRPGGVFLFRGGLVAAVLILVLVTHWPVLGTNALTFDDDEYLVHNLRVQHPSWHAARQFLTEVLEPSTVRGYYQPLTMISLMLDSAAGGQVDNLRPFHRTSLVLHVVNTALVVILLGRLFGDWLVAALLGAVFGLHPMTVEPIAWVGDRKTVLAACFALLSLISYVQFARHDVPRATCPPVSGPADKSPALQSRWLLALSAVLYVLALMSKPTTTLLPLAMLLLDVWPLRRWSRRSVLEKIPMLAIAGLFALITFISQKRTAGVDLPGERSLSAIVLGIAHNLVFYPLKMLWPAHLSNLYPQPDPMSIANPVILMGVLGTVFILLVVVLSLRWTRSVAVGWLIFFFILLPTMGGIGFTFVIASDKYAYLPAVGLLLPIAYGLSLARARGIGCSRRGACFTVAAIAAIAILGAEFLATQAYTRKWQTTESLDRHLIACSPQAAVAYNNLGVELMRQHRGDEAQQAFLQGLQRDPRNANAQNNLGLMLLRRRQLDQAMERFALAVKSAPGYAKARANLALTLEARQRNPEAIEQYRLALGIDPNDPVSWNNLGALYARQGQYAQAIDCFGSALRFKPDYPDARANLQRARELSAGGATTQPG